MSSFSFRVVSTRSSCFVVVERYVSFAKRTNQKRRNGVDLRSSEKKSSVIAMAERTEMHPPMTVCCEKSSATFGWTSIDLTEARIRGELIGDIFASSKSSYVHFKFHNQDINIIPVSNNVANC